MDKKKVKELIGFAITSMYISRDSYLRDSEREAHIIASENTLHKAIEELDKSDWISVNEELPEYGEKVVVCEKYYKPNEPWVTFRDITSVYPKDENDFRELAGTKSFNITHWQHIKN